MKSAFFPARPARTHYRHELRNLTYVTLDHANGGIVRNLNHEGVALQAVAPLRQQQHVRLRFELRSPRLRVEGHGRVCWSTPSGQCGIRFVDLPERTQHQIDEWIFSNLVDAAARLADPATVFETPVVPIARARGKSAFQENSPIEADGLILSSSARPAIRIQPVAGERNRAQLQPQHGEETELNWLSRPLSGRTVAGLVDTLVMIAGLLLFALIFLAIAHELPPWPLALGAVSATAVFVVAAYWALFNAFGGASLGTRLAQAATGFQEEEKPDEVDRAG